MYDTLKAHAERLKSHDLKTLAAARADLPALEAAGWKVNFSRAHLDDAAEAALIDFGTQAGLTADIKALFAQDIVNLSEGRPALHWALRATTQLDGLARIVRASLEAPLAAAKAVRAPDSPIKAIVHIGIGGSDFGPRLLLDAFQDKADPRFTIRFAANVDPHDLDTALTGLDPATTLIIGVSKSFGTEETLYNLSRARDWMKAGIGEDWRTHFALVTANADRALEWLGGERSAFMFYLPESVGGRYSIWSAASFVCMAALGPDVFEEILRGAEDMDTHVRSASLEDNVPACLALLDYWNATCRGEPMRVLLAYANRLRLLPTYLQQLEMESNGKTVGPAGTPAPGATAPALWGGEGSVGQHSYHQWLHQGSHAVPTEFVFAPDADVDAEGRRALTAHALAQAEVLCNGRSLPEIKADEPDVSDAIAQQKVHAGGRPSTFMMHADFNPHALGALIAMYEHRTYLAGRLWGLNPFDQWGVERGKVMAGKLKSALSGESGAGDAVTAALIKSLER